MESLPGIWLALEVPQVGVPYRDELLALAHYGEVSEPDRRVLVVLLPALFLQACKKESRPSAAESRPVRSGSRSWQHLPSSCPINLGVSGERITGSGQSPLRPALALPGGVAHHLERPRNVAASVLLVLGQVRHMPVQLCDLPRQGVGLLSQGRDLLLQGLDLPPQRCRPA